MGRCDRLRGGHLHPLQAFESTLKSWEDKQKGESYRAAARPRLSSQQSMEYLTEEESNLLQQVSRVAETLITRSGCGMGDAAGTGKGGALLWPPRATGVSSSHTACRAWGSPSSSSPSCLQDPRGSQGSQSHGAGAGTRCQHQLPGTGRSSLQQSCWQLGGELGLGAQGNLHLAALGPCCSRGHPPCPIPPSFSAGMQLWRWC